MAKTSRKKPSLPKAALIAINEPKSQFAFDLRQVVKMRESREIGTVIGRAEYVNARNSYLIRYEAGDRRQVEAWWSEDAIDAA